MKKIGGACFASLALAALLVTGCASIPSPDRDEAPYEPQPPTATRVRPYQNQHPPMQPAAPAPRQKPRAPAPQTPMPQQRPQPTIIRLQPWRDIIREDLVGRRPNGLVVNWTGARVEIHIVEGHRHPRDGLVVIPATLDEIQITALPIMSKCLGPTSPLAVVMGARAKESKFFLPPGDYTALYRFRRGGCSYGSATELFWRHFSVGEPFYYRPYPFAAGILLGKTELVAWLLEIDNFLGFPPDLNFFAPVFTIDLRPWR